jgi:hypothetical protein
MSIPMYHLGSHWTDFREIWYLNILLKSLRKIQLSLKSTKITGTLHGDQNTFLIISRSFLLRMRNVADKSCRGSQNTRFVFSNFFFPLKSCILWDNVGKYCRAGQATDENMAHPTLHAEYLRLQTHNQNVVYIFLHCNNGCTNAPQCYVIRTLPVQF